MKEPEYNKLHNQAVQIQNEVEDGRNTAQRIGKMFVDLVESQKKESEDVDMRLSKLSFAKPMSESDFDALTELTPNTIYMTFEV